MITVKASKPSEFIWLSQLRFLFTPEDGEFGICGVKQTNNSLEMPIWVKGGSGSV